MGGFRRSLLGYRRAEVDSAITARDLRIAEWEKAVAERDSRLREVDSEMVCLSRMVLERERAAQGRPLRYLVPDAVAAYIEREGLYR